MLVTDLFNQNQLSPHLSKQALFDLGVARQQAVPSRELAAYVPVDRNPLDLIAATESQMLPDLLALRHQRMGVSPFTFFRGTAELMEHDLAEQSHSGIQVIISGDAHVNNYGFYASPERKLLFGLNDFDEARIGNWEDDLKRLLVSTYLAGQSNGFSERDLLPILTNVTRTYRHGVKYANALTLPERFYFSYEIHDMMATIDRISDDQPHKISTILEKILKKSPQKNSEQVIAKLTTADEEGRRYFIEQAPRAKRVPQAIKEQLIRGYHRYLKNTREDVRVYLTNFTVDDVIRYAVGVGSFGTHCYLMLLSGNDGSHLVLQVKEALPLRASLTALSSDRDLRLAQERLGRPSDRHRPKGPPVGLRSLPRGLPLWTPLLLLPPVPRHEGVDRRRQARPGVLWYLHGHLRLLVGDCPLPKPDRPNDRGLLAPPKTSRRYPG